MLACWTSDVPSGAGSLVAMDDRAVVTRVWAYVRTELGRLARWDAYSVIKF
jgi:hypothetical protein